jgi:hypothetical protein
MKEVLNQLQGLQDKYHKNLKTIISFRTALPIEVCFKSLEEMFKYNIEYAKMQKEYTYLKQLVSFFFTLRFFFLGFLDNKPKLSFSF